jgi:GntR family uxuAB operon transcriptional repressor
MNDKNTKIPVKRQGAAAISLHLRTEIRKGNLQFHDKLPAERDMAEYYGVARGTVREALARLEKEKFVETRPGSGTYIVHKSTDTILSPIEDANPLELIDARFALEPHICRLAVLHGRIQEFDRLEALCDRMETSRIDPSSFSEFDTEFHKVLSKTTGNKLLIWMISQITAIRGQSDWQRMRQLTLNTKIIAEYNRQHRQIVMAIRTREPETAANLMKDHLETARLSLTRAAET